MEESVFFVLFIAVVIYIVLGNYLYFAKILPTLDESPKLMPSGQFDDADRYLQILDERGERPWYVPLLRHQRKIATGYVIVFAFFVTYLLY